VPMGGDEPPSGNGWRIAVVVLLVLMIALLAFVLLSDGSNGNGGDSPTTTTVAVDDTTTTSLDATTTTEATTTTASTTTTTTASTTTAATAAPRVDSLTASDYTCPDPLTLAWTSTNAASVEVAIDNPGGVYDTGPPDGSMLVPSPCGGDTQTYYVTAISSSGERSTKTLVLP